MYYNYEERLKPEEKLFVQDFLDSVKWSEVKPTINDVLNTIRELIEARESENEERLRN